MKIQEKNSKYKFRALRFFLWRDEFFLWREKKYYQNFDKRGEFWRERAWPGSLAQIGLAQVEPL